MYLLFDSLENLQQATKINQPLRMRLPNQTIICVVRTATNIHVFDDTCPHLGESLSKGKVNYLGEIVCPWHTYRFQLNTGEEQTGKSCRPLRKYSVNIVDGQVYVSS
ncbi:MAG: Rieske (2Fe-2S) protein [Thermoflexibacteraceae bacterium]